VLTRRAPGSHGAVSPLSLPLLRVSAPPREPV